jgi:hypothetical protein
MILVIRSVKPNIFSQVLNESLKMAADLLANILPSPYELVAHPAARIYHWNCQLPIEHLRSPILCSCHDRLTDGYIDCDNKITRFGVSRMHSSPDEEEANRSQEPDCDGYVLMRPLS